MVQQITLNQSKKKQSIAPYIIGIGLSSAIGSLHGVAKEFDNEIDTHMASREYREQLNFLRKNNRWEEYYELLGSPKRVAVKNKGLRKILHPFDLWIRKGISKLPKGDKLINYLNKSNAKIKPIFGKLVCDKTLMFKGATFAGSIYLIGIGIYKLINKIIKSKKQSLRDY